MHTLSEHFAHDHVSVEELERRLDRVYKATTPQELEALVSDLPVLRAQSDLATEEETAVLRRLADPSAVKDSQVLVAVMGGTERHGDWTPARRVHAFAVMGGMELDFREATFASGETVLTIFALMGGVDVIVPPDIAVRTNGVAVMGGFGMVNQGSSDPAAGVPSLTVNGFALMGGVDVQVRLPGESARDARRRLKQEKKERRKRLGGKA